MRDLFDAWEDGRALQTVVGFPTAQPEAPVDEGAVSVSEEQLAAMVPALARPANRRTAVSVGLIAPGSNKSEWLVRSPSALAMIADLISSGLSVKRTLRLYEDIAIALGGLGRVVAGELAAIAPRENRTALLQCNRPLLGRAAATLLIAAIGEALPPGDTDRIRIGAIKDHR